jgi:nucleoside-triphosphatase THEP1
MARSIVILTGERGAGKTTVCQETIAQAQSQNYACYGLVTLTQPDGERDVIDISCGETRRLTVPPDTKPIVIQGKYCFDPVTLGWGSAVLAQATSCHLLVIDELGPLEIEQKGGWTHAFNALRRSDYAMAIVVIRPELVVRAQLQLPISATTVFAVTPENRNELPAILLDVLKSQIEPH